MLPAPQNSTRLVKGLWIREAFREVDRQDMMHLKDSKRFKMVKCLVKYFMKAIAKSIKLVV